MSGRMPAPNTSPKSEGSRAEVSTYSCEPWGRGVCRVVAMGWMYYEHVLMSYAVGSCISITSMESLGHVEDGAELWGM